MAARPPVRGAGRWYPQLERLGIDQEVANAIRILFDNLYEIRGRVDTIGSESVRPGAVPVRARNGNDLLGILARPQIGSIPSELSSPSIAALDADGNVVADKVIESSILAGALALIKMKADSLARMFTADTKRTNVEALENNGELKAVHFNQANFGIKVLANNLITSSVLGPATGWVKFTVTATIDVPNEVSSLELQMVLPAETGSSNRRISTGVDNIGFSITSGAGPATPQVSRQGSGPLTQSSPVKGTGLTLTVYVNFTTGTFFFFDDAKINQDTLLPVAIGKVT